MRQPVTPLASVRVAPLAFAGELDRQISFAVSRKRRVVSAVSAVLAIVILAGKAGWQYYYAHLKDIATSGFSWVSTGDLQVANIDAIHGC